MHVVKTEEDVRKLVPNMIGKTLVTKQTGANGLPCNSLYIVEKVGKINIESYNKKMSLMKNIFPLL